MTSLSSLLKFFGFFAGLCGACSGKGERLGYDRSGFNTGSRSYFFS